MRLKHYIALIVLLAVSTPVYAQVVPPPVQYVLAPEAPGPYEPVIIEAQGVGSFMGSANITWSQDGKVMKTGVGERTYSFKTGGIGQRTVVRVNIDSSQGFFTQSFVFNPSRINLVWEADTTVPPFFLGKARYSAGSDYKVVAYPTVYSGSSRISAAALSYQWFYRGEPVPDMSGLGRNIFTHTGDQLQASEEVAVDVYYGSAKVGRAELSIPVSNPMIVLYQRDPLRGVLYDEALPATGISLIAKEITVQAEPFFFATAAKQSGLIPFVWTINDTETTGPDSSQGILTLRQTGSGTGSATLGVSMQNSNPDQFVQTAQTSMQIVFGATQGNALTKFFGL